MQDLTADIAALCKQIISDLPRQSRLRSPLTTAAERVTEPLTVAVAGRLKSGKSTLVNALLGQRVAPVAAGECTRVVTWFRYGPRERVTVTPHDGAEWTVSLSENGRLPEDLGAPAASIHHVTVWLSNARLEQMTLIDTPGLDSSDTPSASATEDLLGLGDSVGPIRAADALIFLLPHLLEQDNDRLHRVASALGNTASSPITTLAVLSRIDELSDDPDPWPHARRTAAALSDELRLCAFDVLPVNGLIAETAAAEAFTESDARALRTIAGADADAVEIALLSPSDFRDRELPATPAARERLLELLGLQGVRRAVRMLSSDAVGTAGLLAHLAHASGFAELDHTLGEVLAERAPAVKARQSLDELERLSYTEVPESERAAVEELRRRVGTLSLHPDLHQLAELSVLRMIRRDGLRVPAADLAAAERLVTNHTPQERLGIAAASDPGTVAETALAATTRWQSLENDPRSDRDLREAAATLRQSLMIIWEQASTDAQPQSARAGRDRE
ncbi:MAG: isoniazid inducible gene protein IniC [Acidimicrobiales bacterium]|nr:MAG: isoniazid inducible gene protein IniC [Acidimicrobiales bacterium]